jgi:zinc/manganese transport system substrate-binding protein
MRRVLALLCLGALPLLATGCGSSSTATGGITVVAAENFWGSIARQLGGAKATVTSIITNPATDPHEYEPTPKDGRAVATAKYVIENGVGYDPWAAKLVGANPSSGRRLLDVGSFLGLKEGDNPHQWYSPASVRKVIDQITADFKAIDPNDAAYFDQQRSDFTTQALATYNSLIAQIQKTYPGVPVGASESIFAPLAQGLGLNLITPASFLNAISEGSDPTAQDKATCDQQIKGHQIKVYVYNSQNATPDVQAQVDEAKAAGIPIVTITETLSPATASFQDWQSAQLRALSDALAKAQAGATP